MKYIFIIFIFLIGCTDQKPIPEIAPPLRVEEKTEVDDVNSEEPVSQEKIDEAFQKEMNRPSDDVPSLDDLQKETLKELKKENDALSGNKPSVKKIIPKQSRHFIVVGSFKTNHFYEEMVKKIESENLQSITTSLSKDGVEMKTVKIGPLESKEEALKLLEELKSKGFPQDAFAR